MAAQPTTPPNAHRHAGASTRQFGRRLASAVKHSSTSEPACLVHLDVAGATSVRDAAGAAACHALHQALTEVVAAQLDESAVCTPAGGCSFRVLLEGAGEMAAHDRARRLKAAVDDLLFEWHGHPYRLQAYAGVVVLDAEPGETGIWLERAREACAAAHDLAGRGLQVMPNDPAAWNHMRQNRDWVRHLSEIIG